MTITARNRIIKGGAACSMLLSLLAFASFIFLCRNAEEAQAPEGFFRLVSLPQENALFSFNLYAAAFSVLVLSLAGTVCLLRVYFLFEKTPSTEIIFFSASLIAVSAEAIRLLVPAFEAWSAQPSMMFLISRWLLFARVFFVLSTLAGAAFSLERGMQKSGQLLFFILATAFFIASGAPLNRSRPLTAFFLPTGYSLMFTLIFVFLLSLSSFSLFIQAKVRGVAEYYKAAAGNFCLSAGWLLLGICDCWAFLAGGAALFFAGAFLYVRTLHKYYLWQ